MVTMIDPAKTDSRSSRVLWPLSPADGRDLVRRGIAMSIGVPESGRLDAIPGVCGGDRKVRGTRIPVWGIIAAFRAGASRQRVLEMYPVLSERDIDEALRYANSHSLEIDAQIADSMNL